MCARLCSMGPLKGCDLPHSSRNPRLTLSLPSERINELTNSALFIINFCLSSIPRLTSTFKILAELVPLSHWNNIKGFSSCSLYCKTKFSIYVNLTRSSICNVTKNFGPFDFDLILFDFILFSHLTWKSHVPTAFPFSFYWAHHLPWNCETIGGVSSSKSSTPPAIG